MIVADEGRRCSINRRPYWGWCWCGGWCLHNNNNLSCRSALSLLRLSVATLHWLIRQLGWEREREKVGERERKRAREREKEKERERWNVRATVDGRANGLADDHGDVVRILPRPLYSSLSSRFIMFLYHNMASGWLFVLWWVLLIQKTRVHHAQICKFSRMIETDQGIDKRNCFKMYMTSTRKLRASKQPWVRLTLFDIYQLLLPPPPCSALLLLSHAINHNQNFSTWILLHRSVMQPEKLHHAASVRTLSEYYTHCNFCAKLPLRRRRRRRRHRLPLLHVRLCRVYALVLTTQVSSRLLPTRPIGVRVPVWLA
jgi:hypothetical protein